MLQAARGWFGRSIKRRLVLLFLLLAVTLASVIAFGAQRAFSSGWRDAARPLLADYVDRLGADITGPAGRLEAASITRAQALTERLPITVRIDGPVWQWASHPGLQDWHADAARHRPGAEEPPAESRSPGGTHTGDDWAPLLTRHTADGHRIRLGIDTTALDRRQRQVGGALLAVLLITAAAYAVVRRLLRPLDGIGAGAQRFGRGDFATPIPVRHPQRPDELDQLAVTMNTMADDIRQMLEAKRALLPAISHELRSPLTRARLNVELLPETADSAAQRQALLRDLQEMARLVTDLLESERLAGRHAALQREPTDLAALAREVLEDLQTRQARAASVVLRAAPGLPVLALDKPRMRLLLRNLLDNALRHGAGDGPPPELSLQAGADGGVHITLRDHGPGVSDEQLPRLAQAFYRPDSARTRTAGGVGLGLYLCRLVTEAHGGRFELRAARPGLAVHVHLPGVQTPTPF